MTGLMFYFRLEEVSLRMQESVKPEIGGAIEVEND